MDEMLISLEKKVLASNDEKALELRKALEAAGVFCANLISSPGSGKTALVTALAKMMIAEGYRVAVLVGDCATDNDARRIASSGAMVRQIVTEGICHLEATMVVDHLSGWDLDEIDLLLIENVGNLVCPTGFDLGQDIKIALISTTEGEDKPLKYPALFSSADLAVVTKLDLASACEFDEAALLANFGQVNPEIEISMTSAKNGTGVSDLMRTLEKRMHERRAGSSQGKDSKKNDRRNSG